MKPENVQKLLEIVAAVLYCSFLAQEVMREDGMLYARFMKSLAKVCRAVAGAVGHVGIRAELEYGRAIERERMN